MHNDFRGDALIELRKSFVLASQGHRIEMFSKYIDNVWHSLIDNEKGYVDFSIAACGDVIVHEDSNGAGVPSFARAYENLYGKFPEVWFRTGGGILNSEMYSEYMRNGEIKASWKCSGTHNCSAAIKRKPTEEPKDSEPTPVPAPLGEPTNTQPNTPASKG